MLNLQLLGPNDTPLQASQVERQQPWNTTPSSHVLSENIQSPRTNCILNNNT